MSQSIEVLVVSLRVGAGMVDDTVPTPHPQLVRRIKRDRRGFRDAGDEP
jgi:hypothetical protein